MAIPCLLQALQKTKYEDWFWKFQVGKCYYRLGMFRDAEKMFKSALKQQEMIDVFLHLSRVRDKNPSIGHDLNSAERVKKVCPKVA